MGLEVGYGSRWIFVFFEAIGWFIAIIGFLLGLAIFGDTPQLGAVGLIVLLGGLLVILITQMGRAVLDAAKYAKEIAETLKNKNV